jgi:hypothetical protein
MLLEGARQLWHAGGMIHWQVEQRKIKEVKRFAHNPHRMSDKDILEWR